MPHPIPPREAWMARQMTDVLKNLGRCQLFIPCMKQANSPRSFLLSNPSKPAHPSGRQREACKTCRSGDDPGSRIRKPFHCPRSMGVHFSSPSSGVNSLERRELCFNRLPPFPKFPQTTGPYHLACISPTPTIPIESKRDPWMDTRPQDNCKSGSRAASC
jgi:hypothetical protein